MHSATVRTTTTLLRRRPFQFSFSKSTARPFSTSSRRPEQFHGADDAVTFPFPFPCTLVPMPPDTRGTPPDLRQSHFRNKDESARGARGLLRRVRSFFFHLYYTLVTNATQLVWPVQSALARPRATRSGRRDEDGLWSADRLGHRRHGRARCACAAVPGSRLLSAFSPVHCARDLHADTLYCRSMDSPSFSFAFINFFLSLLCIGPRAPDGGCVPRWPARETVCWGIA